MADNQGWVKLYRQLLDKPIWLNSRAEHQVVLITLLLMAQHDPVNEVWRGSKYTVNTGQIMTTLGEITARCGKSVSVQNVRSAIKRFMALGFISNESTNQKRLIKILNWDEFQKTGDNKHGFLQ